MKKFSARYWAMRHIGAGCKEVFGRLGYYFSLFLSTSCHRSWLRIIRKYKPSGRLLDAGCGLGYFLRLVGRSYDCCGVDISKLAVSVNRNRGSNVLLNSAEALCFRDESFDVITCFDVLEHLDAPPATVKTLSRLLKVNGILTISIPNLNSIGIKLLKSYWHGYLDSTHVSIFPKDVLIKLLEENGLVVEEIFSVGLFFIILRGGKMANAKAVLRYLHYFVLGNLSLIGFGMGLKLPPIGENLCIVARKCRSRINFPLLTNSSTILQNFKKKKYWMGEENRFCALKGHKQGKQKQL